MRRASLSGTAKPQTRSAKATLSHQERTAAEPREKDIYTATVAKVTTVNDIKDTKGFNVLPTSVPTPLATCADV
jgi:hypothetical protein